MQILLLFGISIGLCLLEELLFEKTIHLRKRLKGFAKTKNKYLIMVVVIAFVLSVSNDIIELPGYGELVLGAIPFATIIYLLRDDRS
jgi:hypothetical protein